MNKTSICHHCCCQPDPCTTDGLPHSLSVAPEAGCILAGAGRSQLLSFFSGAPSFYLTILIAHQSDGVPKPYNHIVAFTMSARYLPPAQTQTRSSRDTRLFKSTFLYSSTPIGNMEKKTRHIDQGHTDVGRRHMPRHIHTCAFADTALPDMLTAKTQQKGQSYLTVS